MAPEENWNASKIVSGVTISVAVCGALSLIDGCLTRPVAARDPITNTNFITSIQQSTIDKVDLLFDIDNSASMGDKEAYLAQAIPDLVSRLVTPNCVDSDGQRDGQVRYHGQRLPWASNAEFSPVHNLHIGIVSSSLGGRLGGHVSEHGTGLHTTAGRRRDDRPPQRHKGTCSTVRPTTRT